MKNKTQNNKELDKRKGIYHADKKRVVYHFDTQIFLLREYLCY